MALKERRKVKTAAEALIATVAACAALILLNAVSCRSRIKTDLTEQQIYSLLPASKRLCAALPERMTVRAYFGNVPAEQAQQKQYVDDLLAEYAASSGGKLVYEKMSVDASDSPAAAERQKQLAEDGVKRVLLMSVKNDRQEQVPAYFHVQFSYLDKKEVWQIPNSFVAEGLEYEFSTIIRRLAWGKKKIGITQGFGEPPQHKAIDQAGIDLGNGTKLGLADLYEIVPIDWAQNPRAIDDDSLALLIVNGPTQAVSEAAQWHLDQHLMKGRPAVLLLPGMLWEPGGQPQQPGMPPDSNAPFVGRPVETGLADLLAHYGFVIGKDIILDGAGPVRGYVPLGDQPVQTNLFFLMVAAMQSGKNQPLEGLRGLVMPYASTLTLVGPAAPPEPGAAPSGVEVKPLFTTSPQSFAKSDLMILTRTSRIEQPKQREQLGPYVVGVTVEGSWTSFFAGKPAPEGALAPPAAPIGPDGEELASPAQAPSLTESQRPARLVVVSAAEFASDRSIMQMKMTREIAFANGFLALHSLADWAVEDTDLLSVRAKQVLRPLDGTLDDSERRWVKYGNIAGVPLALALFGVVYWQIRERRRRKVKI